MYLLATRTSDHLNFYDNYKRLNTNYHTQFIETIKPNDFSKEIRVKSPDFWYSDNNISETVKNHENGGNQENNEKNVKMQEMMKTGTEHWNTTYASSIVDPYSYAKASRPLWSLNKPPYSVDRFI